MRQAYYLVDLNPILRVYARHLNMYDVYCIYPLKKIVEDICDNNPYCGISCPEELFFDRLSELMDEVDPSLHVQPDYMMLQLWLQTLICDLDNYIKLVLKDRISPWDDMCSFGIVRWVGNTAVMGKMIDDYEGVVDHSSLRTAWDLSDRTTWAKRSNQLLRRQKFVKSNT